MVSVQGCRYKQKAEGIFVLPLSNNLRYTLVTSLDILKDGELEDNWNTWVEEKMAVVQPVLDQLNK